MKLVAGALGMASLLRAEARIASEPEMFRWTESVSGPGGKAGVAPNGRVCAVLDGSVYAHAEPALADVRLFAGEGVGRTEVPYALTISEAAGFESVAAAVLNEAQRGGHVSFDLRMPARPYSQVDLDIQAVNFRASATVMGLRTPGDGAPAALGKFTLFDLTRQKLGRSTTLRLPESTFPYLRVELEFAGVRDAQVNASVVKGAEVPPSREAQTLYTVVAETGQMTQRGRESVAEFEVPAHVPVERVSFVLLPGYAANFNREVRIDARAAKTNGNQTPAKEELTGEISRVRLTGGPEAIRESGLSVPAILGSNGQSAAKVEVAVENGEDAPVGIAAVRLEMRQRKLCFDAPGVGPVAMYYGARGMRAPAYVYSGMFRAGEAAGTAQLGPERANPAYVARVEAGPFEERHRGLLWGGMLGGAVVLGGVAWGSTRRSARKRV